MDWTDIDIFNLAAGEDIEAALQTYEPVMVDGLTISEDLQSDTKDHFEAELRRRFASLQTTCLASDSTYDILNHIDNPKKLGRAARYYCVYMLFYGQLVGTEGIYNDKADEYHRRYELAFTDACGMLEFDDGTEEYTGTDYGSVRFVV